MPSNSRALCHRLKGLEGLHTRVFEAGDPGNPAVVLIHGATVAAWEFNPLIEELLKRGFYCLSYDLFGHGLSSKPYWQLDKTLLVKQACEVTEQLLPEQSFTLLGHSLGGAIASELATLNASKVDRLILLAPMLNFLKTSPVARLLGRPVFGRLLMYGVGRQYLRQRRHKRLDKMHLPELKKQYDEAYYAKGYWQSMLSLFQSNALGCQRSTYLQLSQQEILTQILWGQQDKVIPEIHVRQIDKILSENPLHQQTLYLSDAEHNFVLTQARRISELAF